ncbi:MAG: hypothetical protein M0003_09145 [Acidithiobacillus sp.]|nr:hypothetical protein [Acidithiobacillus sp.]
MTPSPTENAKFICAAAIGLEAAHVADSSSPQNAADRKLDMKRSRCVFLWASMGSPPPAAPPSGVKEGMHAVSVRTRSDDAS